MMIRVPRSGSRHIWQCRASIVVEQRIGIHSLWQASINSNTRGRGYATNLPKLDLPALDLKWQKRWDDTSQVNDGTDEKKKKKEKKYILPMFPYPSGNLHLGHFRNYTIPDVLSRYWRMKGYDVLLPMGWDAFGLPAENAAIERGIDPAVWTKNNIRKMKTQLRSMNGSWDWSRVGTLSASYQGQG